MNETAALIYFYIGVFVSCLGVGIVFGRLIFQLFEIWWDVYRAVKGVPLLIEKVRKLREEAGE